MEKVRMGLVYKLYDILDMSKEDDGDVIMEHLSIIDMLKRDIPILTVIDRMDGENFPNTLRIINDKVIPMINSELQEKGCSQLVYQGAYVMTQENMIIDQWNEFDKANGIDPLLYKFWVCYGDCDTEPEGFDNLESLLDVVKNTVN